MTTDPTAIAIEKISAVHENAKRVNKASRDKVEFIHDILEKSRSISQNVNEIHNRSTQNTTALNNAVSGLDQSIQTFLSLAEAIKDITSQAGAIEQSLKAFDDKFQEASHISTTITDVSKQTNMLALNAMIEAQRAGQQGKGFEIVAKEVKRLAQSTQSSSHQIDSLISALFQEMTRIIKHFDAFNSQMSNSDKIVKDSFEATDKTQNIIHRSIEDGTHNSEQAAQQVSHFNSLVNHLETLIKDTENAITGSQANIDLTRDVLEILQQPGVVIKAA